MICYSQFGLFESVTIRANEKQSFLWKNQLFFLKLKIFRPKYFIDCSYIFAY